MRYIALCCFLLLVGCEPPPEPIGNVVLITLDTVRADHIGCYGHDKAKTPVIDELASEGMLFERAMSVAPITMPTHSSILTGQYPYRHGARNNGSFPLDTAATTLAERFSQKGYDTVAMVSAMVLDSKYGLDQGFDVYDDDLYAGGAQKMFMFKEVRAEITVDKAIAQLRSAELDSPFFMWMHLFDAHADHQPPPPYDVLFLDQPYDGEIAYVDKQLGRLFHAMKEDGLYDDTTIVLVADHGDSLGDHGEQTHGIFVYHSTTHVPLIVKGPTVQPGRAAGLVSQVDIAPTLVAMAGLEPMDVDGLSLASTLTRDKAVPRRDGVLLESISVRLNFGWHELRAVETDSKKYIDAPRPEVYDLTTDFGESNNIYGGEPPYSLARQIDQWEAVDDMASLKPSRIDKETVNMLEALGYVSEFATVEDDSGELPDPKDRVDRWVDLQLCQAMVRAERHTPAV
ncbi:MAG: sulfatase, partial [Proteobacteria bacterium]|nr:sulfatase [Pseudomonadota bacterium]